MRCIEEHMNDRGELDTVEAASREVADMAKRLSNKMYKSLW